MVIRLAVKQYFPNFKLNVTSRKSVWTRLVSAEMFKPYCLKTFMIFFLMRSDSWPEAFSKMAKPSSLCRPTLFLPTSGVIKLSINRPTNSHTSAPSYDPIVTSKSERRDFLQWWMILMKSLLIVTNCLANIKALSSSFFKING